MTIVTIISLSIFLGVLCRPCNCDCKWEGNNNNKVQGIFVFGSSVFDNGNNNYIDNCTSKVNYLPYGIDFPGEKSSGRYGNGKNVADLLVEHLKIPHFIPPFKDPSTKGNKIIHGVNFASGSSGILEETGHVSGQVISLNEQLQNLEKVTLPELEGLLGCKSNESLGKYLFLIGIGNNDFSLNYFNKFPNNDVTLLSFINRLLTAFSDHLQSLYMLGARKFVIMSIYPNGCTPTIRARVPKPIVDCVHSVNSALHLYNVQLRSLLDELTKRMPGSKLILVNVYKIIMDIIRTPHPYGFNVTLQPCCELTTLKEGGTETLCKKDGNICPNRNKYVYFDGLHPTEAVNVVIANTAFDSTCQDEVYPTNVKSLLEE